MARFVPLLMRDGELRNARHENVWRMVIVALVVVAAVGFFLDDVDGLRAPTAEVSQ
jgi:hypothetical protein